jgi:hypothetical protein
MSLMRWGGRLLIIHMFLIVIIWLSSYFSGLDIALTLAYIFIILRAGAAIGCSYPRNPYRYLVISGFIAQFPGWVLTALNLYYYGGGRLMTGDYAVMLQLWHTPFMPLLSFFAFPVFQGYNFYFLALFALSFLYTAILVLGYVWKTHRRSGAGEVIAPKAP